MKIKTLYFSLAFFAASMSVNAQNGSDPIGHCASYIQTNPAYSLQADSIYKINKTTADITVDAVAEGAWANAFPRVLSKVGQENASVIVNLDNYPQTEAYGHATFKALWTDNGVYMYITVKDNEIRYQNPTSPWENDGIEFFFAKKPGDGLKQIIVPAMVGTTDGSQYPAALDFESGSAVGSNPAYQIFGYDANNWDASTFRFAIRKTTVGFDIEVYMDKDIVTNGNSSTNYGLDKMFAGDINYDFAGNTQNSNTPPLYVREGILAMLGNNNNGWATSAYYGYFKLVNEVNGINTPKDAKFSAIYNSDNKEIKITSSSLISTVAVYNVSGQVMPSKYNNESVSVSGLKKGVYMVKAQDVTGNCLGVQKVVLY